MSSTVIFLRPVDTSAPELQQRLQASAEAEALAEQVIEAAESYRADVARDMLNRIAARLMMRAEGLR